MSLFSLLVGAAALVAPTSTVAAPAGDLSTADTVFVRLRSGQLRVLPARLIARRETTADRLVFTLRNPDDASATTTLAFPLTDVVSTTAALPDDITLPRWDSYKFNNKFNGNLPIDAEGTLSPDGNTVQLTVGSIDRTLIPSFSFAEADRLRGAKAYLNGVEQVSKQSLTDCTRPLVYTLAFPEHRLLDLVQTAPGQPGTPDEVKGQATVLALRADQLSSNYPSPREEDAIAHLVDGKAETHFHTYWEADRDLSIVTYVDIALDAPIQDFQLAYTTRLDAANNMPATFSLLTSDDGKTWTLLRTFSEADGVPFQGYQQSFTTPTLHAGAPFKFLRFRNDRCSRPDRNYLCLAELTLSTVDGTIVPGTPAIPPTYALQELPYGRRTTVLADFPAQSAGRVPRIDINLADGLTLAHIHAAKDIYRRAQITIDGAGIWPDLTDSLSIKGRGNSTWSMPKKPYRLKFDKSAKPFGLTKGRNWVLLANHLRGGAQLNNAIAMKVAQFVGTLAPNHIIPVEFYVNGQYLGLYNLTEQVSLGNNSIAALDEQRAALIELDTYEGDGDPYFYEPNFYLRTKYKDPDPEDYEEDYGKDASALFFEQLQQEWNTYTASVLASDYEGRTDLNALARYFLVNDLIGNLEFRHPKSIFVHRANLFDAADPWVFGPVWDCDWAYGFEQVNAFAIADPEFDALDTYGPKGSGMEFFRNLMTSTETAQRYYYFTWKNFMERGGLDALNRFIDDFTAFAAPAFAHDHELWGSTTLGDYTDMAARMKSWLTRRAQYIYSRLTPYPESENPTGLDAVPADPRPDREVLDLGDLRTAAQDAASAGEGTATRRGLFTLDGRRLDLAAPLSPGLYILNGHKVVVKK